eukprot:TRINITY_DN45061_c0_g2_i1.p1 TRINITY_DN45061_c0_g2~~TRINITY_DN45061_c0_g2_i1.p1  ORF type:complete len:3176 (+),score=632.73 TRINITY_DN45061_c0_g2_i1:145-9672(+)
MRQSSLAGTTGATGRSRISTGKFGLAEVGDAGLQAMTTALATVVVPAQQQQAPARPSCLHAPGFASAGGGAFTAAYSQRGSKGAAVPSGSPAKSPPLGSTSPVGLIASPSSCSFTLSVSSVQGAMPPPLPAELARQDSAEALNRQAAALRNQRLQLTLDRWMQCDNRATLYDRFARWRRLARRSTAMRDVAISAGQRWDRCALIQAFASWQGIVRHLLRCELEGLLLRSTRRSPLLNAWANVTSAIRYSRKRRCGLAIGEWKIYLKQRHELTRRCASFVFSTTASRARAAMLRWRVESKFQLQRRKVLRSLFAGWRSCKGASVLREEAAEQLLWSALSRASRRSFAAWWQIVIDRDAQETTSTSALLHWQHNKYIARWYHVMVVGRLQRHRCRVVALHLRERGWRHLKKALAVQRAEAQHRGGKASGHRERWRCRVALEHWKALHKSFAERSEAVQDVLQTRKLSLVLRSWCKQPHVGRLRAQNCRVMCRMLLEAWRQRTRDHSCRHQKLLEASCALRRSGTLRALRSWLDLSATRRLSMMLLRRATHHWSHDRCRSAMATWGRRACERRRRNNSARAVRSCVLRQRSVAAVQGWRASVVGRCRGRRLACTAEQHWLATTGAKTTKAWRSCVASLQVQRKHANACRLMQQNAGTRLCFDAWGAAVLTVRREAALAERSTLYQAAILRRSAFTCWHTATHAEKTMRNSLNEAVAFDGSLRLRYAFAAMAQEAEEGRLQMVALDSKAQQHQEQRLRARMQDVFETFSSGLARRHQEEDLILEARLQRGQQRRGAALRRWRSLAKAVAEKRALQMCGAAAWRRKAASQAIAGWTVFARRKRLLTGAAASLLASTDGSLLGKSFRGWARHAAWSRRQREIEASSVGERCRRQACLVLGQWLQACALRRMARTQAAQSCLVLQSNIQAAAFATLALYKKRREKDSLRFGAARAALVREKAQRALRHLAVCCKRLAHSRQVLDRFASRFGVASKMGTFKAWQDFCRQSRRARFKDCALARWLETAKSILATSFGAWKNTVAAFRRGKENAKDSLRSQEARCCQEAVAAWKAFVCEEKRERNMQTTAMELWSGTCTSRVFLSWRARLRLRRQQLRSAESREEALRREALQELVLRWRAAALRRRRLRRLCQSYRSLVAGHRRQDGLHALVKHAVLRRRDARAALEALRHVSTKRADIDRTGALRVWRAFRRTRLEQRRADHSHRKRLLLNSLVCWRKSACRLSSLRQTVLSRMRLSDGEVLAVGLRAWRRQAQFDKREREVLPMKIRQAEKPWLRTVLEHWKNDAARQRRICAFVLAAQGQCTKLLLAVHFSSWTRFLEKIRKQAEGRQRRREQMLASQKRRAFHDLVALMAGKRQHRMRKNERLAAALSYGRRSLLSVAMEAWLMFQRLRRRTRRIAWTLMGRLAGMRRKAALLDWRLDTVKSRYATAVASKLKESIGNNLQKTHFQAWLWWHVWETKKRTVLAKSRQRLEARAQGTCLTAWCRFSVFYKQAARAVVGMADELGQRAVASSYHGWLWVTRWQRRERQILSHYCSAWSLSATQVCCRAWIQFVQDGQRAQKQKASAEVFCGRSCCAAHFQLWRESTAWLTKLRHVTAMFLSSHRSRLRQLLLHCWHSFTSWHSRIRSELRRQRRARAVQFWKAWLSDRRQGRAAQQAASATLRDSDRKRALRAWQMARRARQCHIELLLEAEKQCSLQLACRRLGNTLDVWHARASRKGHKKRTRRRLVRRQMLRLLRGCTEAWAAWAACRGRRKRLVKQLAQEKKHRHGRDALTAWYQGSSRKLFLRSFVASKLKASSLLLRKTYMVAWRAVARMLRLLKAAGATLAARRARKNHQEVLKRLAAHNLAQRQRKLSRSVVAVLRGLALGRLGFNSWQVASARWRRKRQMYALISSRRMQAMIKRCFSSWHHISSEQTNERAQHLVADVSRLRHLTCQFFKDWCHFATASQVLRRTLEMAGLRGDTMLRKRFFKGWQRFAASKARLLRILAAAKLSKAQLTRRTALRRLQETSARRQRLRCGARELQVNRLQAAARDWLSLQKRRATEGKACQLRLHAAQAVWAVRSVTLARKQSLACWSYNGRRQRAVRSGLSKKVSVKRLQLLSLALKALTLVSSWRGLKRRLQAQGVQLAIRSCTAMAWSLWQQCVATRKLEEKFNLEAMSLVSKSYRPRLLRCVCDALKAYHGWRVLKRGVLQKGLGRCSRSLQKTAFGALSAHRRWRLQKKQVASAGRTRRELQLLAWTFPDWRGTAAKLRREAFAIRLGVQRTTLLQFLAWRRAVHWWRTVHLSAEALRSGLADACLSAAFQAWLTFGAQEQRLRRLSRAAIALSTSLLSRRALLPWRDMASRQKAARQKAFGALMVSLQENTRLVLELWRAALRHCRARRAGTVDLTRRWSSCFAAARRKTALSSWRSATAYSRWTSLATQEAALQHRDRAKSSSMQRWFAWADIRYRRRKRMSRAVAHAVLSLESRCLLLWSAVLASEKKLRERTAEARLAVRHIRQGHALVQFARGVGLCRLQRLRSLEAFGFARLRLTSDALDAWVRHVADIRSMRFMEVQAAGLRFRMLAREAMVIWRCVLCKLRVAQRALGLAIRLCWMSWLSHMEERRDWRQHCLEGRVLLQQRIALRRWARQSRHRGHHRCLLVCTDDRRRQDFLEAAMTAWQEAHLADCRQRRRLRKWATLRHWRCYVACCNARRHGMQCALASAAAHRRRQLALATLQRWCWHVAWTAANLEAAARLVTERRQRRQREVALRRQVHGHTDEERAFLHGAFGFWKQQHHTRMRRVHKLNRQGWLRKQAKLVRVLDLWCAALLQERRSEDLRRRRHVRLDDWRKDASKVGPRMQRVQQQPAAVHAPRHAGHAASPVPPGNLGQWAKVEKAFDAVGGLSDIYSASHNDSSGDRSTMPQWLLTAGGCGADVAEDKWALKAAVSSDVLQAPRGVAETGSTVSPAASLTPVSQRHRSLTPVSTTTWHGASDALQTPPPAARSRTEALRQYAKPCESAVPALPGTKEQPDKFASTPPEVSRGGGERRCEPMTSAAAAATADLGGGMKLHGLPPGSGLEEAIAAALSQAPTIRWRGSDSFADVSTSAEAPRHWTDDDQAGHVAEGRQPEKWQQTVPTTRHDIAPAAALPRRGYSPQRTDLLRFMKLNSASAPARH